MARGYGAVCLRKLRMKKVSRRKVRIAVDFRQPDLFLGPVQQELF